MPQVELPALDGAILLLVHVKPPMLAVELVPDTFTQSVSECLCRAYNMNQVTQSVGFIRPCRLKPVLDSLMANELV